MRRRRPAAVEVPDELATFVPERWADDLEDAVHLYRQARLEWLREHRGELDAVWYIATTLYEVRRARDPDREWPQPGRRHR